jgi:hypothetical protein
VLSASAASAATWDDLSTRTALAALDAAPIAGFGVGGGGTRLPGTIRPDATEPALVVNFVVAGPSDPNGKVPALNAVPGSGVANLSIADPETVIPTTGSIVFSVASNVLTLPAQTKCTTSIAVTAGTTKLYSARTKPYTVSPLTVWLWAFVASRPTYSGPATMVGKVSCTGPAGTKSTMKSAALFFQ